DAYMKRATLLTRLGQYRQASEDMDRALLLNPMSDHILDSRAKLRILLNDPEGAELDIRQAMVLAPYDPLLRRERVDEWLELGRTDLALLELDTLLGEAPGDAG
ncbi:MAG: hypothetical protein KDC02_15880, partial [Flavobacteriales bacterium]|nr:hypothetical protein [Flavobacteriales bacterium]